jgi:hypothetical protein
MARSRFRFDVNAFIVVGVTLLILGMAGLFWGALTDDADAVASNTGVVSGAILVSLVGLGILWWQRR